MSSIADFVELVFNHYRPKRKWNTIYWLVDVHGVIIPGNWKLKNDLQFTDDSARQVLKWISNRNDQRLILWTSSYKAATDNVCVWLSSHGIVVDYINENPEERNTEYADFSLKPYFNIAIDDKAGFNPYIHWTDIKDMLISIEEWDDTIC